MRPIARWEMAVWYLFLVAWMQGMALFNLAWGMLLLAAVRHVREVWPRLRPYPMIWGAALAYEGVRVVTTLFGAYPKEAAFGLFDDVRAMSVGLIALIFIRNRDECVRAAWASFIGVTVLAWWSLAWQIWHFGLQSSGDIIFGTFAHLNYAACYSMIALLMMLLAFITLPFRKGWPLLLGIVPIAIMQLPLSSRTAMLAGGVACVGILFRYLNRKSLISICVLLAGVVSGLAFTANGLEQFGTLSKAERQIEGEKTMPSMQIRTEIWGLLLQVLRDNPLGVGPRNHGFVDLNRYRGWIRSHMSFTIKAVYGVDVDSPSFDRIDFNHPNHLTYDPHSQYFDTLVDGGVLGLVSLLMLWGAPLLQSWRYRSRNDMIEVNRGGTNGFVWVTIWMLAVSGLTTAIFHQAGLVIFYMVCALVIISLECGCEHGCKRGRG